MCVLAMGCQRSDGPPVAVAPEPNAMLPDVPSDPFGTPGPAYDRLREITDAGRNNNWSGQVDELADWLEEETQAVEQSRALMRTLRLGAIDVYAVANGRIALLYEHIAATLIEAGAIVKDEELDLEWMGQEVLLWQQANGFWERCAYGSNLGGPYLAAWQLRCQAGVEETAARIADHSPKVSETPAQSARQSE